MSQDQLSLFPEPEEKQAKDITIRKLTIERGDVELSQETQVVEVVPEITLPTRWEYLEKKIENKNVSIRTIIRPIREAMQIVWDAVEYLKATSGCQLLVICANTGSGKTTFLNTLNHYMPEADFRIKTIDLQRYIDPNDFGENLWKMNISQEGINLIILEGKENPESIDSNYIQIVLSNINRFSRAARVPILFVIPTIEAAVARNWCVQAQKIGDLISEREYDGARWYTFPGLDKKDYIEVAEETVRVLNNPYSIYDFSISPDELRSWRDNSYSIGEFMSTIVSQIQTRRRQSRLINKGPKEHVWVVYCSPDYQEYDRTYRLIDGLVKNEKLQVNLEKLIPPSQNTPFARDWRKSTQWQRLLASISFLDVRLINISITTVVTAALVYADDDILQSFKDAKLSDYKDKIPKNLHKLISSSDWSKPLAERRLQVVVAKGSMESTNLVRLLRGKPAEQMKGGNRESIQSLAQYLHLREMVQPEGLHYYIGCALRDLLPDYNLPGYIGVETEQPLIEGQISPQPDVTIRGQRDTYALEFHFRRDQIASSQIAMYAIKNVVEKYMKGLPYLNSQLESIRAD